MPRLETPLGRDGPIIDVRIWIGLEHKEALKARGLQAPRPLSVPRLLDTGAQMTAIQQALAQGIGLPVHDWVRLRSSVLGAEERDAPVYLMRMTFGRIEAPDPPKWRIVTLPIAKARGFSGYPELQESVPGQCPGIYA